MARDLNSDDFRNQILRFVGASDLALLSAKLERVDLPLRYEMERPHRPIKYVYFPEVGVSSVVARGSRKRQLEVGIIGREGMTGLMVVLGNDRSPHQTFVQIAGEGTRIASDNLRKAMSESPTLRDILLRYVQVFLIQSTHTAMSNGSAKLEERLARWLLMAHDRVDGDELPLIHDFLALMLGVQRPGVTVAIHALEGQGLIRGARGRITVIDRSGLEGVANSYGVPEAEYRRLFAEG